MLCLFKCILSGRLQEHFMSSEIFVEFIPSKLPKLTRNCPLEMKLTRNCLLEMKLTRNCPLEMKLTRNCPLEMKLTRNCLLEMKLTRNCPLEMKLTRNCPLEMKFMNPRKSRYLHLNNPNIVKHETSILRHNEQHLS